MTRSKIEKSEFFSPKSENDQNLFLQNQKLIRKVNFLQTNWYYAKILHSNALLDLYSMNYILFSNLGQYKETQ